MFASRQGFFVGKNACIVQYPRDIERRQADVVHIQVLGLQAFESLPLRPALSPGGPL